MSVQLLFLIPVLDLKSAIISDQDIDLSIYPVSAACAAQRFRSAAACQRHPLQPVVRRHAWRYISFVASELIPRPPISTDAFKKANLISPLDAASGHPDCEGPSPFHQGRAC